MRRQIVGDKLIAANILPNLKGFHYIVDAVLDYNAHTPVMIIYDRVANAHKTTRANVWRSIQHAKEKSEVYKKYSNTEFIALLRWELERWERKRSS
jgi:hypothetical protein